MILSYKYNFLYFKALKVAGTSIEVVLEPHCGEEDIVTKLQPKIAGHIPRNYKDRNGKPLFYNHITPQEVKGKIKLKEWNKLNKVTIVRNPWEVMVSSYWWFYKLGRRQEKNVVGFNDWILGNYSRGFNKYKNSVYYFDKEKKPICDYYIRYENLTSDIETFCKKVNMPIPEYIPKLKTKVRENKKHYSEYYNKKTIQKVYNMAKLDIDYFEYKFGEN